ncbi:MAG: hypothetical protein ACRD5J_16700 [Nitrososphaeraceae archaeon]
MTRAIASCLLFDLTTTTEQQQEEQQEQKQRNDWDKGWYCKEHDIKYLCDICGYDSVHNNKQKEMKYYFVNDQQ